MLKASIIIDHRSSIIDHRSSIIDQTHFYTKSDTSTYLTPSKSTLAALSAHTEVDAELLVQLNPKLKNLKTISAGQVIVLPATSPIFKGNTQHFETSILPALGGNNSPNNEAILSQTPLSQYSSNKTETNLANAAQTVATTDWDNLSLEDAKNQAKSYAKNQAREAIVQPIQEQANTFLGKFGKADARISVDDEGNLKDSGFNLLSPFYDAESDLIFSQIGLNGKNDTFIGNFGLGYRHDAGFYLLGANTFIDTDFKNQHTRGGIGLEFWTEPARFSGNYYYPISNWRDADELGGYEARPAKGFDLRLQTYLPSYPHIGGSLMYEQYYGDEVALFGKENLQNDPSAFTVSLDYTPVPLITFKGSYKKGQDNLSEGRLDTMLNIQIGTSLEDQLNPDNVALARSLKGSRYDTVDRNYDIVLKYREKNYPLTIDFTNKTYQVSENTIISLVAGGYLTVESSYALDGCPVWEQPIQNVDLLKIINACSTNPNNWQVSIPTYIETDPTAPNYLASLLRTGGNGQLLSSDKQNAYDLKVSIKDIKGKQAYSSKTTFMVTSNNSVTPVPNDYPSTNLAIQIYDRGIDGKSPRTLADGVDTLPNHYYEVVIVDRDNNDTEVTAYFDKYIRWTYFDAYKVATPTGWVDLSYQRCTGTVMFPTQINNTLNVEQAVLDIVNNPATSWHSYEQGLALVPTIELPDDIRTGSKLLTKTGNGEMLVCNDNAIYASKAPKFPQSQLN